MAVLSLADYKTRARITSADATRDAALALILGDVDEAIKNAIKPFHPEPITVTDFPLDAPDRQYLILPVTPVRSITSIYLRWGANYEAAAFEAADLLTANDQYWLPIDEPVKNYSKSGIVVCRGRSFWGLETRRDAGKLAPTRQGAKGAVLATWAAGPSSVPADLAQLATLAASALYAIQPDGMPAASESWNGYSRSWSGPYTAAGFLSTPAAAQILSKYVTTGVAVG